MRQVPAFSSFLIIGRGRVARHFSHFFELENLPFQTWDRTQGREDLSAKSAHASHVLLLISDSSIEPFARENAASLAGKQLVHFSGSLVSDLIPGAHPLMSFADELYDLQAYQRVPFILERGRGTLDELLPGLRNPWHGIEAAQKGLYHALCVLSGNFTILLWEKTFRDFEERLGLPKAALLPYLERVTQNLSKAPVETSVLTGPLARRDHMTIDKNLMELRGDPFRDVYAAFVKAFTGEREQ